MIQTEKTFVIAAMKAGMDDGQLGNLQRKMKLWRATEGPPKEIFFAQIHKPGELCLSGFTHMTKLGITIDGAHLPVQESR